jgi:hypothetical protein
VDAPAPDPKTPPPPRVLIEWYRVDQTRRIRRALVAGAGILTLGACVMALSFVTHQSLAVRQAAAAFGFLSTVAGALTAVIGMARVLSTDSYLAVSAEGIILHLEEGETFLAWDSLERIRFDAAREAMVFALRDGGEVLSRTAFAGAEKKSLAARLDTLRRRAGFDMLGARK